MCDDDRHPMYAPNCPACNPEGYAELLAQSPPQTDQTGPQPVEPGTTGGYSDTY